jgi:archaetidylinositol phosphate synthase
MTTQTALIFTPAHRVNRSLTAALEQRLLHHLAAHAPSWLTSDQLTLLGFLAQLAAGACYALARYDPRALLGVILALLLNWLGDSLDGTLARVRNQQRPRYGFYVDHAADIFGTLALLSGLALSGMVHPAIAVTMLLAFLILSAESFLATYTLSTFELSQGLFGTTELRLLLIAGNLALLRSPYSVLFGHRFFLFDIGGLIASICMFATAVTVTLRHTLQLYREEPLP